MKNIFYLSLLLLCAFVSFGESAKAQTTETTTGETCEYISDYILPGRANNVADVYKLQAYLHIVEGVDVSFNGVFDAATQNGVRIMQERHRADILAPWGATSATGNVYITTKHFLDEWSCEEELPFSAAETQILNSPRTSSSVIGQGTTGSTVAVGTPAPTSTAAPVTIVSPTVTPARTTTLGTAATGTNTGALGDLFGDDENATDTDATSTATTSGWFESARGSTILIIIVLAAIIYFIISMLSRTRTPNTPVQNPNQNQNNQNRNQNRNQDRR